MEQVVRGRDVATSRWSESDSEDTVGRRNKHLRRARLAVYLCAVVLCVASAWLSAAALSDYLDMARRIRTFDGTARVYIEDCIGVASYNIFAGVFAALIFGAAFFFDLIWPQRHQRQSARSA
ncbi:hypothetical protein LTR91_012412 [Friedmanniomyces endolithicus]|uniref:Uncharacterized protein n=1 Tax=Friedmanniomyces endolithicus TaxID=329885 RepID=A0AAN6KFM5_9PEZI|nr:hypothetical protein LTR94_007053 [Friedmanniomyces endolithicus]KAK0796050.1 hypothetical protein LTR59_007282 [Friedmanniomyces endolithicus]KAK0801147.1 hypothetical protein LTR38_006974 [Friedmanniomyces endolithicus]KAK0820702.1 hypothetical protein LTR75_001580 [Friedmanniomyces endolithicus]KAK0843279.1 hypothetical protein LTR03_008784 [Friedmanniomyces endolithicus]